MDNSISRAEELARIGRENELAELDYEDSNVRIHLTFEAPVQQVSGGVDPALLAAMASAPAAPVVAAAPSGTTATAATKSSSKATIDSPLAGVFYRAPGPDSGPFVSEGDSVAEGKTLCIVEAMKLMNEIAAERPCKISKILIENGEAVEEGQPLFEIE